MGGYWHTARWCSRKPVIVIIITAACTALTTGVALATVTEGFRIMTPFVTFVLLSVLIVSVLLLLLTILRWLFGLGEITRSILAFFGYWIAVFLCLGTVASIYSTSHGYTSWYALLPTARINLKGKPNSGYVHWADGGEFGYNLVVTTKEPWSGTTYWIVVPVGHHPSMRRCGRWTAPRLPVFAIGDVNPPCLIFGEGDESLNAEEQDRRNLVVGSGFVEFTADDGKRVKVEW